MLACVFILILNEGLYKITKTNFNKIKLDSLSLFFVGTLIKDAFDAVNMSYFKFKSKITAQDDFYVNITILQKFAYNIYMNRKKWESLERKQKVKNKSLLFLKHIGEKLLT